MKKLRRTKPAKHKPFRPHCKVCRIRFSEKDFCRMCRKHVCPACDINHVCAELPCECVDDDQPQCKEFKYLYSCTMPPNHDGDHVACGIVTHRIRTWKDS